MATKSAKKQGPLTIFPLLTKLIIVMLVVLGGILSFVIYQESKLDLQNPLNILEQEGSRLIYQIESYAELMRFLEENDKETEKVLQEKLLGILRAENHLSYIQLVNKRAEKLVDAGTAPPRTSSSTSRETSRSFLRTSSRSWARCCAGSPEWSWAPRCGGKPAGPLRPTPTRSRRFLTGPAAPSISPAASCPTGGTAASPLITGTSASTPTGWSSSGSSCTCLPGAGRQRKSWSSSGPWSIGFAIHIVETTGDTREVDTPEDAQRMEDYLRMQVW